MEPNCTAARPALIQAEAIRPKRVFCLLAKERGVTSADIPSLLSQASCSEAWVECGSDLTALGRWQPAHDEALLLIDARFLNPKSINIREVTRVLSGPVRTMVLFDQWPENEILSDLLLHGANGCLLYSSPASLYFKAIDAVLGGELWFPRCAVADAIQKLRAREESTLVPDGSAEHANDTIPLRHLTDREHTIVLLLRAGLTNKEIGKRLGISNETVKKHLARIFRRLGVRNRTQLAFKSESQLALPYHAIGVVGPRSDNAVS